MYVSVCAALLVLQATTVAKKNKKIKPKKNPEIYFVFSLKKNLLNMNFFVTVEDSQIIGALKVTQYSVSYKCNSSNSWGY